MPYTELLQWAEYFKRRPVGYKEDVRTYLLLRAQGVKEKAESIFSTIKAVTEHNDSIIKEDQAVPKGLFLNKMLNAKNGDGSSINWFKGADNGSKP